MHNNNKNMTCTHKLIYWIRHTLLNAFLVQPILVVSSLVSFDFFITWLLYILYYHRQWSILLNQYEWLFLFRNFLNLSSDPPFHCQKKPRYSIASSSSSTTHMSCLHASSKAHYLHNWLRLHQKASILQSNPKHSQTNT